MGSNLDGLLLLEDGREVGQDEADVLILGALLGDEQHVGQHEGHHVRVDELRGERRKDAVDHHSLVRTKHKTGFLVFVLILGMPLC